MTTFLGMPAGGGNLTGEPFPKAAREALGGARRASAGTAGRGGLGRGGLEVAGREGEAVRFRVPTFRPAIRPVSWCTPRSGWS